MDNTFALAHRPARNLSQLPRLLPRPRDAHKGNFGTALLVAGSRSMCGAAVLAGRAALMAGAGLVRVATAFSAQSTVASGDACYTTLGLPEDPHGRVRLGALPLLLEHAGKTTALALGPGLGQSLSLSLLVTRLQTQVALPMVLDADGLNALAQFPAELRQPAGPRILTPHLGELARLVGLAEIKAEHARELAPELARRWQCVLIVKGRHSMITDGETVVLNETGNPGMATGGTGDVLTGLLTGLLAQGLSPWDAAHLGVWIHGLAGDLAAAEVGELSLTAQGLLNRLPQAFQRMSGAANVSAE